MDAQSISSSLRALERDYRQLEESAERVSQAGLDQSEAVSAEQVNLDKSVDLSAERLEQLKAKRDAEAQAKVIQAHDEALGLILDLEA